MSLTVTDLIAQVRTQAQAVEFQTTIDTINANFDYTPTRFTNGRGDDKVLNEAGSNEGSCRLFAFALLQGLSQPETLALFGKYYREDVLLHADASDHANIRTFMRYGWAGIHFDGVALKPKVS
ncbi:MAG: HopJ type III effector protein [Spongiibacteraceae bacterium]